MELLSTSRHSECINRIALCLQKKIIHEKYNETDFLLIQFTVEEGLKWIIEKCLIAVKYSLVEILNFLNSN